MAAASKILNIPRSALHNLICRHLLRPSAAAASNPLPSTPIRSFNLFLPRNGDDKSPLHSPIPYFNLPQWPLGSSLMRIEAARTYVTGTADDHVYEDSDDDDDDSDDDELDDDDLENYSGSDFDDEDEYEDSDQDPDIK